jgi:hypothetical protein
MSRSLSGELIDAAASAFAYGGMTAPEIAEDGRSDPLCN